MWTSNDRAAATAAGIAIAVPFVRHTKNEDHKTCENKNCAIGSRRRGSRDAVIHDGEVTENPALGCAFIFLAMR